MRLHVDDTRVAQQQYLTNSKRKGKQFGRVSHPSISLQNLTKKSPLLDELFPLSAVWVQWEKKIDPRAEILKLGNNGMSKNTVMNYSKGPRGMDLPSRGLGLSEVHFGTVDIWTVFLGCYIWSLAYDCPRYPWFCSFFRPAWIPMELNLPSVPLGPCHICLGNSYAFFKTQLKLIFPPRKVSSPSSELTSSSFLL